MYGSSGSLFRESRFRRFSLSFFSFSLFFSQSRAIDGITVGDVYLEHNSRCNYANIPPARLFAVLFENLAAGKQRRY